MLKIGTSIFVCLSVMTVVLGQSGESRLLDKFDRISCSDFRHRIDIFLAEIASSPVAIGHVALSADADYLDVFIRRKMIDEQLALRNFPTKRVVFVRRHGLAPFEVELWVTKSGAKLPFDSDSTWSYKLSKGAKPFVLVKGGWSDSECPPARDAEFVANFLKANPESRTNIVIRCKGRNCFREMRTELITDLISSGVSRDRLRFFHVPISSLYYRYEFWILN
jgi:hypothetical protein